MPSAVWSVPAIVEEVRGVREAAVQFARAHGVPETRLDDVRLAIAEAVTNAVVHAFRTRDEVGTVTVAVEVWPQRFAEVIVRDDGIGMSPRDDSPGLGLGLALISHVADEIDHRQPDSGVGFEVWMRFRYAVD